MFAFWSRFLSQLNELKCCALVVHSNYNDKRNDYRWLKGCAVCTHLESFGWVAHANAHYRDSQWIPNGHRLSMYMLWCRNQFVVECVLQQTHTDLDTWVLTTNLGCNNNTQISDRFQVSKTETEMEQENLSLSLFRFSVVNNCVWSRIENRRYNKSLRISNIFLYCCVQDCINNINGDLTWTHILQSFFQE